MKRFFGEFITLFIIVFFASCHRYVVKDDLVSKVDSLNNLSYRMRYKNLTESASLVEKAYNMVSSDCSNYPEVLNNLAFCAYMNMDFKCYQCF